MNLDTSAVYHTFIHSITFILTVQHNIYRKGRAGYAAFIYTYSGSITDLVEIHIRIF